ncbi:hypothetical protein BB561_005595 [Smittium simulii]|uniref:Uncharacterized protein n=1 Tax=Smittium simulii TaxID=133385 RepID=A0A2T9Y9L5_9FUNG|nr:hypothetical protein BB561_005595 [Smittium simulii]
MSRENQNFQPTTSQTPGFNYSHARIIAPLVEAESYLELLKAILELEYNFFRNPLKDDKRKEFMQCYPRIIRKNTGIDQDNDKDIVLIGAVSRLISDLASTVEQSRINNLHKAINFLRQAHQFIESSVKPLIENNELDTFIPEISYAPTTAPTQQADFTQDRENQVQRKRFKNSFRKARRRTPNRPSITHKFVESKQDERKEKHSRRRWQVF